MQTPVIEHAKPPSGKWPDLDLGILDEQREVVALPGHLPGPCGTWITDGQRRPSALHGQACRHCLHGRRDVRSPMATVA